MQELVSLWLPIVATTLGTHIASTIAWIVSPHHKPDVQKFPAEDALNQLIREHNVGPGAYMFPGVDYEDMKNPETVARYEAGPYGMVVVWNRPDMGKNIALTLTFFFISAVFIGYVSSLALEPGAPFLKVFQVAGTVGIMAFCFGAIPNDIWFRRPHRWLFTNLMDGIVYGLIAGAVFAFLWPA